MSEETTIYKAEEAGKLATQRSFPAVVLIGTGAVLLVASLFGIHLIDYFWPGFVILPGLLLIWPAYNSTAGQQSKLRYLAIPGAVLLTIGVLLFIMNLTQHFEAWAYSWTLLIAAVAAGLMYARRFEADDQFEEKGTRFMRLMGILFLGLAFFFEIIIFESFNPLMAVGLMAVGVYLVIKERREARAV